jgi:predicted phage terminase large subunit-like protein
MSISKKEAFWAAIATDFKVFMLQAFKTVYPGNQFLDNWHIDALVHHLMLGINGQSPRLIINLPPRHLKSFIASDALPAYVLGRDPTAKIICISYSDELTRTFARDFRRIVESAWYQRVFPHVRFSKKTENEMATTDGGFRFSTSVGGTLTGRGGDIIIIDDPIKPEDAFSDKIRASTNEWYKSTVLSRLDDKKRSVLIVVMQRLHVNDLTGFIGSFGEYRKLALPAIATKTELIPISDTETYRRESEEALHPEREDLKTLEAIKNQIGAQTFSAQYQQNPECPDGAMFKLKWFNIVTKLPNLDSNGHLCVSIDTALSVSESADYSAISLVYCSRSGHYVISAERGRWDYEGLLAKSLSYVDRYGREIYFIVESAGSGISLIQSLRKSGMRCFSYAPKDDKMTRAAYAIPIFHSRRVSILNQEGKNQWVESYLNEFLTFPYGRFDDWVDSLVQLLPWAERRLNPGGKYFSMESEENHDMAP